MDLNWIKSGWVEKRSEFLKKWRKRWLVLTISSLSVFKTEKEIKKPVLVIDLSDIADASPGIPENNEYVFKITTVDFNKYLVKVPDESEVCSWLNHINHTRQNNLSFSFGSPSYYYESKLFSDETLISSFAKIKDMLNLREAELLNHLEQYNKQHLAEARTFNTEISNLYENEQKNLLLLQELNENSTNLSKQLKFLNRISFPKLNFKSFYAFEKKKLRITVDDCLISTIIKANIKVNFCSASETVLRRTNITRALKWRYTGDKVDVLSFQVTKDIRLTGIGLCLPYNPQKSTTLKELKVLKGDVSTSPIIYTHPHIEELQYNPEASVRKISFGSLVQIKNQTNYTILLLMEGASTYKCVDCMENVECPLKTSWAFFKTEIGSCHKSNHCDTTCGPIADFYYILTN